MSYANITQCVTAQANQTPAAWSVQTPAGQGLTFAELEHQSNQAAAYLQRMGVQASSVVGICLRRTPQLIVWMLAILKAGATYLPLDPAYPRARLQFMLTDAKAMLVVSETACQAALLPNTIKCVLIDQPWLKDLTWREPNYHSAIPAYIIYTSGSTGQPKGVLICHANALAFLAWAETTFSAAERAGVLAATSINFDLSIFEIFLPLISGGTSVLVENLFDPALFHSQYPIRLINSVPSAVQTLLQHSALPSSVLTVNLAGEPLSLQLAQQLYQQPNIQRVFNLYGPTETTTYATYQFVERTASHSPAIGQPLTGTTCVILDVQYQPIAAEDVGELFIAGLGVAQGYLQRPDLTAERFLPNPWATTPGERMYKTGDLAHWNAANELCYLGRNDQQVKIRGFRIELAEIEAQILCVAPLQAVVVQPITLVADDPQLTAYVVANQPIDCAALRASLAHHVPSYMLPSFWVQLAELPLTPNGKLDRAALPRPDAPIKQPLQSLTEQRLATIWREILGVEQLGRESNFLQLGGHSLNVMQVLKRIEQTWRLQLSVMSLFEQPSLAAWARLIDQQLQPFAQADPQFYQRTKQLHQLSFGQQRLWFAEQLRPNTAYNVISAWRIDAQLDSVALEQSWLRLIERHEMLRSRIQLIEGIPQQAIVQPVWQLQSAPQASLESLLRLLDRPFDLAQAPLLRVSLAQHHDHAIVLVVIHHSIIDAWSLGVLWAELSQLYANFVENQPINLPTQAYDYLDFVAWQRQQLDSACLAQLQTYWQTQLSQLDPLPALATDYPRSAHMQGLGLSQTYQLDQQVIQALQGLANANNASLFMLLLTGWATVLYQRTQCSDLLIGTLSAGREHAAFERCVGFFINILPLRLHCTAEQTWLDLLQQTRMVALHAYQHQALPFEQIVANVAHERNNQPQIPLIQSLLVLQNAPSQPLVLGAPAQALATPIQACKTDLVLLVQPDATGYQLTLEYASELFAVESIEALAADFQAVLRQMAQHPTSPLSAVQLAGHWTAEHYSNTLPTLQPMAAPPQTALEQTLADMWQEALGLSIDNIHADFFRMGGHSLNATQVVSRIQQLLQVTTSIRMLFDYPTIAQLSQHLLANQAQAERISKIASTLQQIKTMSASTKQALQQKAAGRTSQP